MFDKDLTSYSDEDLLNELVERKRLAESARKIDVQLKLDRIEQIVTEVTDLSKEIQVLAKELQVISDNLFKVIL
jgi:uncharacterized protein YoxC